MKSDRYEEGEGGRGGERRREEGEEAEARREGRVRVYLGIIATFDCIEMFDLLRIDI